MLGIFKPELNSALLPTKNWGSLLKTLWLTSADPVGARGFHPHPQAEAPGLPESAGLVDKCVQGHRGKKRHGRPEWDQY